MKQRTAYSIIAFLAGVATVFVGAELANATGNKNDDDIDIDVGQHQGQEQGQTQQTTVNIGGGEGAGTLSETSTTMNSDDDVSITENNSVENNSSNVVLVPNNNTENCLRVFGFGWGKDGSSGGFGIPWRSAACDYEQAADDAFAAGERELGWYWKCHNKTLYKPFYERSKGGSREVAKDDAIAACHTRAVGEITNLATIDQLRRSVEFYSAENGRLNEVLVRERQTCKDQKDETYERCIEQLRK